MYILTYPHRERGSFNLYIFFSACVSFLLGVLGMAASQGNDSRFPTHLEEEDGVDLHEYHQAGGCGCFRLCGFGSCWSGGNNEDGNLLGERGGGRIKGWWLKKLKGAKEFSEVVAGPKWKNFIRKLGAYFSDRKIKMKQKNNNRFRYDAESYALNFDDFDSKEEEDGLLPPQFSSRFPPPSFPPTVTT